MSTGGTSATAGTRASTGPARSAGPAATWVAAGIVTIVVTIIIIIHINLKMMMFIPPTVTWGAVRRMVRMVRRG